MSTGRHDADENERTLGAGFILEVLLVIALLAAACWYAFGGTGSQAGGAARPAQEVTVTLAPARTG